MDDVLRKLLDGVRRVHDEWEKAAAMKRSTSEATANEQDGSNGLTDAASDQRREQYRRTMQMLMRFESSFRRASWKSGCEMTFPILFGHLSFTTHRCWTVFMRKAIYLAAEAWRQHYGHTATHRAMTTGAKLDFELPNGEKVTLPGWSERKQVTSDGVEVVVYVSPEGEEFDSLTYASEALKHTKSGASRSDALKAMSKLLIDFKEGHCLETQSVEKSGVEGMASKGKDAFSYSLSQLDDYLHRGEHDIVRNMNLYIYSMWVYRAERNPYATSAPLKESKPRHLEIPFEESYVAGKTWVQRIAIEPRIPKVEGFQFVTDVDPEMHFLLKSVLLRPIQLGIISSINVFCHSVFPRFVARITYQNICLVIGRD